MATHIEWTEVTWNPVTGCTPTSPGCAHCYAERMARRLQAMGQRRYRNGFRPTFHEDVVERPLVWRKSRMVFVNSIRDQCVRAGVPFFFKQWGGVNKKAAGRVLDGRAWDEMPSRHVPSAGDDASDATLPFPP